MRWTTTAHDGCLNKNCSMRMPTILLCLVISLASAQADWLELHEADCEGTSDVPYCEYVPRIMPVVVDALEEGDRMLERLAPRLLVTGGELDTAFDIAQESLGRGPDTWTWRATWAHPILSDPVFPLVGGILDSALWEGLETWEQIVLARALSASGHKKLSRELFQRLGQAVQESPRISTRWPERVVFANWASASFEQDAIAFLPELSPVSAAWARFGIAEGLAYRGDIEGVTAQIALLPGDMPIVGKVILAEAFRRSGDSATARQLLDEVRIELPELSSGLRNNTIIERLAAGFAILGDLEAVTEILGEFDSVGFHRDTAWYRVAPLLACHGLTQALEAVGQSGSAENDKAHLPWLVADVLVAAAASGHADEAYAFASTADSRERATWLLAVLIGLGQEQLVTGDPAPCPTLSTLPN